MTAAPPPGLVLTLDCPLRWLDRPPGTPVEVAARALDVLERLEALEERPHALDEDPALGRELARLERKLDTVLELRGALLDTARPRPPARAVDLRADALTWTAAPGTAPPVGARGWVELYLAELPWPLVLAAEITATGDGGRAEAVLPDLSDALADALTRLIFRRHRRAVASSRKPALS